LVPQKTMPTDLPEVLSDSSADHSAQHARDRLKQKISVEADLPALGNSVSRVVQMSSSNHESVRNLANFILSDVALTQKILRISNTVCYRTFSGTPVTTVSKAIFLLGFDTVKTAALAMLLVEGMNRNHAKSVRDELNQALCASIIGREMARRSQYKDAEEAAIAALFKNIGRVLIAAHDHEMYQDIASLVESGSHTPVQASIAVLGCSFDLLAEGILREWNIPETIIQALTLLPSGALKPAKSRQEWVQQVAAFSSAAARLIPGMNDPRQEAATKALLTRFGNSLGLDQQKLSDLLANVSQEVRVLANTVQLGAGMEDEVEEAESPAAAISPDAVSEGEAATAAAASTEMDLLSEMMLDDIDELMPLQITSRHASGKPMNARDLLLAGVQDAAQMMASGRCRANDLMMLVLETLYNSLGFRFATVCLKDIKTGQFKARVAIGDNSVQRQTGFVFPEAFARDLFHLALQNDADLMISDAATPKIRDLVPAWHRTLLPDARSFIVLPLVVQKKQLGLFYADRAQAAPEGVPPDEISLIKTLKGQVLTALIAR
jgi:HD-like signal output (HDOD) protein